jgi:hypothetical protein
MNSVTTILLIIPSSFDQVGSWEQYFQRPGLVLWTIPTAPNPQTHRRESNRNKSQRQKRTRQPAKV